MSHSLSKLLLLYAQQFEDQHAPQNMTIAVREAAKELDRMYAGGCARDQGTTQYCADAARLAEENERLRAALEAWDYAVRINLTMEGPSYAGVSSGYGKKAWELTRAALTQEPRT